MWPSDAPISMCSKHVMVSPSQLSAEQPTCMGITAVSRVVDPAPGVQQPSFMPVVLHETMSH